MKKKLLVFLVCLCLALGAGTTLTAFAGISTNSPTGGTGLLSGGGLSSSFVIRNDNKDKSAYKYQIGNSTYRMKDVGYMQGLFAGSKNPIPKADVVDGSKFVMQMDVYDSFNKSISAHFDPFCTSWANPSPSIRIMTNQWHLGAAGKYTYVVLPEKSEILVDGAAYDGDRTAVQGFGWHGSVLTEQKDKGRDYATFWFEFDVAEKSMTLYAGYDDGKGTPEKKRYGTLKNSFTIAEADNYYFTSLFDNDLEIDNYKVYRVLNDKQDKTYVNGDFEDPSKLVLGNADLSTVTKDQFAIRNTGGTYEIVTKDSLIIVENPDEDTRIASRNPLGVNDKLETTFELTSTFKLDSWGEGSARKVGLALGLDDDTAKLSAPEGGASLIYFTVNSENKVVLGVDSIAEDGAHTAIGEQIVIGLASAPAAAADEPAEPTEPTEPAEPELPVLVGENAPSITLNITGKKDGSIDIKVNDAAAVNFKNVKVAGNLAIGQTGTGDVKYSVYHADFNLTGYQFAENAGGTVSSRFDGNFISPAKFNAQSTVAPEAHITAVEGSHEVAGMVVENQKVGFYGSSTNTVLTFANEYADFVMQVDYTSVPSAKRGKLSGLDKGSGAVGNRFSPLYLVFGGEAGVSPLADYYALGIIEGNPTQYFWGVESLIDMSGKIKGEGASLVPLAGLTDCEQTDPDAILVYKAGEGANEGKIVPAYGKPNPTETKPTFYNRTTRFKLVVINNNIALYSAEVDTATGNIKGEYVKLFEYHVKDSFGYAGIATDSPAWAEIDNLAITPISSEKAIELGVNAVPSADLVADINPSDMDEDPEPTPLATPAVTVDAAGKKVTWNAVEGAANYKVNIKLGKEVKVNEDVTAAQYDLSKLTEEGEYTITVVAVPEDLGRYRNSKVATAKYTVEKANNGGNQTTTSGKKKGCGSNVSVALGSAAVLMLGAAAFIAVKRRKNER